MFQNSVTITLFLKLWQKFRASMLYCVLLAIFDFFVISFRESKLKKILISVGNFDKYVKTSLFYSIIGVVFSFVGNILVKFASFVLRVLKGSLVERIYKKGFADSVIFGYRNFFPFLAVAIFLVPHDFWNNMYGLVISMCLLVLYIFSMAYESKKYDRRSFENVPFSFLFFAFALIIAVAVSYDVGDSVRILFFFISSFLMCFSVYGRVNSKEMLDRFMRAVYFSMLILSVFAIVQRILGVEANASLTDLELNADMPGRVFATLDNPNNFAEYLTVFMPFGFAYAMTNKDKSLRNLYAVGMLLPLVAIILTYSRSGWIALAAAVVVYVALYNYKIFPAFIVGGAIAIPFLPSTVLSRIMTIGNMKDSSSSYRVDIWTGALDMLEKYWFTGVGLGPGGFAKVFPDYAVGDTTVVMHSHMQFMEMMVEGGILLFAAYIAVVFGLIRRSCVASGTAKDNTMKHYAVASCASVAGITLIGLFEYCWFYPRVMFAFFISAGLCLAISKMIKDDTCSER